MGFSLSTSSLFSITKPPSSLSWVTKQPSSWPCCFLACPPKICPPHFATVIFQKYQFHVPCWRLLGRSILTVFRRHLCLLIRYPSPLVACLGPPTFPVCLLLLTHMDSTLEPDPPFIFLIAQHECSCLGTYCTLNAFSFFSTSAWGAALWVLAPQLFSEVFLECLRQAFPCLSFCLHTIPCIYSHYCNCHAGMSLFLYTS